VTLEPNEIVIVDDADPSELLYRQICAHVWDAQYQRPHLDAFGPQGADKRKPSFARASIVSAQESRDWHDKHAKSKSTGVWACSVAEVEEAQTRAVDDSGTPLTEGEKRSPGHAFIDYRHMTKPEMKAVKAALLMKAIGRREIATESNIS
jgi:hypothetical protein